jgi:hypothetical protein
VSLKVDSKKLNKKQQNNDLRMKGLKNSLSASKMMGSFAKKNQSETMKFIIKNSNIR